MWNAIKALRGSIVAAVLIGFGSGLVLGAVQGIFTGSETPSEATKPTNTPSVTTSPCSGFEVLLIGVETPEGSFTDVEQLVRLLEDADVTAEVQQLPWKSEEISSQIPVLVDRAQAADSTIVLLRLGTGDAQFNLATALAEGVGSNLRVLAGGAGERQSGLGGLLERSGAGYRSLSSVVTAEDVMSDQETTEVARWLIEGFDCGRVASVSMMGGD